MKTGKYSADELGYIYKNLGNLTIEKIAENLDRSVAGLKAKIKSLKIVKPIFQKRRKPSWLKRGWKK